MSAVTAGVKDVREVIERARHRLGEHDQGTILFLDEIHRFTKSQQDALLPAVEDGTLTLIGATTENPFFEVNPPLRSRSTLFRLEPLDRAAMRTLVERGLAGRGRDGRRRGDRPARRTRGRRRPAGADVARGGVRARRHRARRTRSTSRRRSARARCATAATTTTTSISAFIKSMRGSDPEAAVYWLARMLEAGEDARFIARRMIIFASEDVGMADPQALLVAVAAAHALEHVGLPEAQLNLSPGGDPPGHRAEEQPRRRWRSGTPARTSATARSARCRRTCATPHYQAAATLGHGDGLRVPS